MLCWLQKPTIVSLLNNLLVCVSVNYSICVLRFLFAVRSIFRFSLFSPFSIVFRSVGRLCAQNLKWYCCVEKAKALIIIEMNKKKKLLRKWTTIWRWSGISAACDGRYGGWGGLDYSNEQIINIESNSNQTNIQNNH